MNINKVCWNAYVLGERGRGLLRTLSNCILPQAKGSKKDQKCFHKLKNNNKLVGEACIQVGGRF